jgi:hypothetical protein
VIPLVCRRKVSRLVVASVPGRTPRLFIWLMENKRFAALENLFVLKTQQIRIYHVRAFKFAFIPIFTCEWIATLVYICISYFHSSFQLNPLEYSRERKTSGKRFDIYVGKQRHCIKLYLHNNRSENQITTKDEKGYVCTFRTSFRTLVAPICSGFFKCKLKWALDWINRVHRKYLFNKKPFASLSPGSSILSVFTFLL